MKPKLIVALLIFTLVVCLMPNLHPENWIGVKDYLWQLDVVIHGSYYFILSLIIFYLLCKEKISTFLIMIILFVFSSMIEFLQIFIPKRSVDMLDISSNLIGVFFGFIVFKIRETIVGNKNKI